MGREEDSRTRENKQREGDVLEDVSGFYTHRDGDGVREREGRERQT